MYSVGAHLRRLRSRAGSSPFPRTPPPAPPAIGGPHSRVARPLASRAASAQSLAPTEPRARPSALRRAAAATARGGNKGRPSRSRRRSRVAGKQEAIRGCETS